MPKLEVYQRTDDRWAWRLVADNGQVIATDGGQGYENRGDCEVIAHAVVRGAYAPPVALPEPELQSGWVMLQCPTCPAQMVGRPGDSIEHGLDGAHIYSPAPLGSTQA